LTFLHWDPEEDEAEPRTAPCNTDGGFRFHAGADSLGAPNKAFCDVPQVRPSSKEPVQRHESAVSIVGFWISLFLVRLETGSVLGYQ
jgi:hypothetical protein